MVNVKQDQPDLLDQVQIDLDSEDDYDKHVLTFKDPMHDIVFGHDFIAQEVNKYNLSFDGCSNCSQFMRHFSDLCSLTDALAAREISWQKLPDAIMSCPMPSLLTPLTAHWPLKSCIISWHKIWILML